MSNGNNSNATLVELPGELSGLVTFSLIPVPYQRQRRYSVKFLIVFIVLRRKVIRLLELIIVKA